MPIYFGAPNVGDWTPNEPSVIRVDDYGSAKDLADHIKMLNANEEEYLSLLQHKPSLKTNQKKFPDLISNGKLLEALEGKNASLICLKCLKIYIFRSQVGSLRVSTNVNGDFCPAFRVQGLLQSCQESQDGQDGIRSDAVRRK